MPKAKNNCCSFCGRAASEVQFLVPGGTPGVFICDSCIDVINGMIQEMEQEKKSNSKKSLGKKLSEVPKPVQIKEFLDQYVIG